MKQIRRWRIEILTVEDFESLKIMTMRCSRPPTMWLLWGMIGLLLWDMIGLLLWGMVSLLSWVWWASSHGYDGPPFMGMMGLLSWVWWAFYYEYGRPSIMILSGLKSSTANILMRHRRICFIFEALNSASFTA